MTTTIITWRTGQVETFNGLNGFKTVSALVKYYKALVPQYCSHSFTVGIKNPHCNLCKLSASEYRKEL